VGDLADRGAQLSCCVDQVQVGAVSGGGHLSPPAGEVGPGLLGGVESGGEAVLVGVRVDVAGASAGVHEPRLSLDQGTAERASAGRTNGQVGMVS
jgi:hypothetical protein